MEEPVASNRMYSILLMSEAIARGDIVDIIMSTFKESNLSLEQLILWRHPTIRVNIFQFAILHRRVEIVQSLGNMWPFFLTDKSFYELNRASIAELACMASCVSLKNTGDKLHAPPIVLVPFHGPLQENHQTTSRTLAPTTPESLGSSSDGQRGDFQQEALVNPCYGDLPQDVLVNPCYGDLPQDVLVNPPLHLACMVGCIETIKFLLRKKCNFYLNKEAFICIGCQETQSPSMKWVLLPWCEAKKAKPFEICVAGGHIDCVSYFINNIIVQCLTLRFLYTGVQEPSSMLHMACSIGCGPLVKLLLGSLFLDDAGLSDKNGKSPLHIAVWNGDTDTIRHLLEGGAMVNVTAESKGCLHILYRAKLHPFNYVANTRLLIQHGMDVHLMDKNGISAFHILAEEIGMSQIHVMRYWKKAAEAISEMTTSTDKEPEGYSMEVYQSDLLKCLELLLDEGRDCKSQTTTLEPVLEVLLQFSSLPSTQTTLWNSPKVVYRAVQLLLSHNANSNAESCFPDMSIFTYFIFHHLQDIEDEDMKRTFVHLFTVHGADLDGLSFCYPLVAAVEKLTPLNVVELMMNLMSTEHFLRAMCTIQQRFLPAFRQSDMPRKVDYSTGISRLFESLGLRSLKHICKVDILSLLSKPVVDVQSLPLPAHLKEYIISDVF